MQPVYPRASDLVSKPPVIDAVSPTLCVSCAVSKITFWLRSDHTPSQDLYVSFLESSAARAQKLRCEMNQGEGLSEKVE